ncbi:MAG: peroxiredoxin family protein [Actinobacteria bacterium]|nr:peroxiredoxin family protein [Actinomycetota bacterium]MBU1865878.1 peroxiredoxin family protein [Actinomycetota bacterium]
MRTMRSLAIAAVGVALLGMGLAACGSDEAEFGVGSDAPAFSLPDSTGGTVALGDYGDEPVLLFFHMADG